MKIVICLTFCAAIAFAGDASQLGASQHSASHPTTTGSDNTDGCVFSQTYSFPDIQNAYRYFHSGTGVGYICDDFILDNDATVRSIHLWMSYPDDLPMTYDMLFIHDSGDVNPNNGAVVWSGTVVLTHIDTGDDWYGTVWETIGEISPTEYPDLMAGERYWVVLTFQGNEFWLVRAPIFGSNPWGGQTITTLQDVSAYFSEDSDTFFEIWDSPVSCQRETWGSIKSTF